MMGFEVRREEKKKKNVGRWSGRTGDFFFTFPRQSSLGRVLAVALSPCAVGQDTTGSRAGISFRRRQGKNYVPLDWEGAWARAADSWRGGVYLVAQDL